MSGWTFREESGEDAQKAAVKLEYLKKEQEADDMDVDDAVPKVKGCPS